MGKTFLTSFLAALIACCYTTYIYRNDVEIGEQLAYLRSYNAIYQVMDDSKFDVSNNNLRERYNGLNLALTAVVNEHGGLPAPSFNDNGSF